MNNLELFERKSKAISNGVGMQTQIFAEKAKNAEIWDVEGVRYIDFAAGIAAANAVLDVIADEKLCDRANEFGSRLKQNLNPSDLPLHKYLMYGVVE